MIYLSRGIVQQDSTDEILNIQHSGQTFQLAGIDAQVWLDGRYSFSSANMTVRLHALEKLKKAGLVVTDTEDISLYRYRILSQCTCCPTETARFSLPVLGDEKMILSWLKYAGLRLSVAELVYLMENDIKPIPKLLYTENRQALTETIYLNAPIGDGLLECKMETSMCRDRVVNILMSLLRKKKIIIL